MKDYCIYQTGIDYSSQEYSSTSPLSLFSLNQKIYLVLRAPHVMEHNHWHSQIEINIPFDGDVEYEINGDVIQLKEKHIGLFWASVPHRLTKIGDCTKMGIIQIPIHIFLSWSLDRDFINKITHGMVLQSEQHNLTCEFEINRWISDFETERTNRRQLAIDEMSIMLKRVVIDGYKQIQTGRSDKTKKGTTSKHAQFYVSKMLMFMADNSDSPITTQQIADHVSLNVNYAMGVFQNIMQITMKQYLITMRISHARALLSDTDNAIIDIGYTVGFNSSSRFYDAFKKYVGLTPHKYRKSCQ